MNQIILPGPRTGSVTIPASKSQAHRLLICAALGQRETVIRCGGISRDIAATMACLRALGAEISEKNGEITVKPIAFSPIDTCHLPCGESGSTLRFLLPVAGALGAQAIFHMEGRLPQRPLAPLDAVLREHGMVLRQEGDLLFVSGQLTPGDFSLPGNVSSQYISGLLMALPRLAGDSTLTVTGPVESASYIAMTQDALSQSGISFEKTGWTYTIPGDQTFDLPRETRVEGDFSSAAFFLCLGALSPQGVEVTGLEPRSSQGDRAVLDVLEAFGAQVTRTDTGAVVRRGTLRPIEIDAGPIPDLIPVLSVVAAAAPGDTHVVRAGRLRLKESDRIASTCALLRALGASVDEEPEGLVIHGGAPLTGGTVDPWGDHRIAMSAAVAASLCREPVTVLSSECTEKSYPDFWRHLAQLKGATQ